MVSRYISGSSATDSIYLTIHCIIYLTTYLVAKAVAIWVKNDSWDHPLFERTMEGTLIQQAIFLLSFAWEARYSLPLHARQQLDTYVGGMSEITVESSGPTGCCSLACSNRCLGTRRLVTKKYWSNKNTSETSYAKWGTSPPSLLISDTNSASQPGFLPYSSPLLGHLSRLDPLHHSLCREYSSFVFHCPECHYPHRCNFFFINKSPILPHPTAKVRYKVELNMFVG